MALHNVFYMAMAAIAVPCVFGAFDRRPRFRGEPDAGWQETIFPPYFVVGAMFSGFAMVALLAAAIRWGFGFQSVLTVRHFETMALIILASSLIMTLSYATEWFSGWYGGQVAERGEIAFAFTGSYAPFFWLQLFCNCAAPQILWCPRMRRSIWRLSRSPWRSSRACG